MKGKYDDIISLPHHTSEKHPRMPREARAAQFSPFAALTGYEDAIQEASRVTENRIMLEDSEKSEIDRTLRRITENGKEASLTYFLKDSLKEGGIYLTAAGCIEKTDMRKGIIVLSDGTRIAIEDIAAVREIQREES